VRYVKLGASVYLGVGAVALLGDAVLRTPASIQCPAKAFGISCHLSVVMIAAEVAGGIGVGMAAAWLVRGRSGREARAR
jgi:hypothetical protein